MTHHYPDLSGASDWLKQISWAARPIRSTAQIWVVTRHQHGISVLISQLSFCGETSGDATKCHLFSQAKVIECCRLFQIFSPPLYPFALLLLKVHGLNLKVAGFSAGRWHSVRTLKMVALKSLDRRSKHFAFVGHFVNSHKLFSWWCMDIVGRKLILVTLAKLKQRLRLKNVSSIQLQLHLSIIRKLQIQFEFDSNSLYSAFEVQNIYQTGMFVNCIGSLIL